MEKFLDKNGLITYTNKMKEYINSKCSALSEIDIKEVMAGIHIDWYKVNGEKINSVEATSENTYDFHQYISETDLETDENKIIHIAGDVKIDRETEEPYPIITVSSANYVTMSGNTITETLGAVSGINITGDMSYDDAEYVNMNITYKGISISESFLADAGGDTHQG
jgi:hypothetical protein